MLEIVVFLAFAVAAGAFVGGVLSSGVVIAYLKRAETAVELELEKVKAEGAALAAKAAKPIYTIEEAVASLKQDAKKL